MLHLLLWRLYLPSHHLTVTENALIVVGCRLVHQTVCFWTPQQRAERLRENPGCTADSSPWLALDNPLNLPLALPPLYAPSPTHPFPPPPPDPLVPGATICEFISALTALLGCHIASCTHRQSTITVLGLFIFHTPSFHLPLYRHAMLPTVFFHCYPSPCIITLPSLGWQDFSSFPCCCFPFSGISLSRASWMCLLGLSYEHGLKLYIRTLKGFFFCLHLPSQEMQPQQPECLTWNTHKL